MEVVKQTNRQQIDSQIDSLFQPTIRTTTWRSIKKKNKKEKEKGEKQYLKIERLDYIHYTHSQLIYDVQRQEIMKVLKSTFSSISFLFFHSFTGIWNLRNEFLSNSGAYQKLQISTKRGPNLQLGPFFSFSQITSIKSQPVRNLFCNLRNQRVK